MWFGEAATRSSSCSPDSFATSEATTAMKPSATAIGPNRRENRGLMTMMIASTATSGSSTTTACTTKG